MDLAALSTLVSRPHVRAPYEVVLPGLAVFEQGAPSAFEAAIYEPVVVVVLRGAKETMLGDTTFPMRAGECLVASHDLPVVARVVRAPYAALLFDVDMNVLRDVVDASDAEPSATGPDHPTALGVHRCEPSLVDALGRYLSLAGTPRDAAVLGPLVVREIHYRLATSPLGRKLRARLREGSAEGAIARAIAHLRSEFRESLEVAKLARTVGMSVSSFHKHFRAITASTPVQFQKELRLLEARRLLRAGRASVAEAAFEVGYESATQFSREYGRKFGAPPRNDRLPRERRG